MPVFLDDEGHRSAEARSQVYLLPWRQLQASDHDKLTLPQHPDKLGEHIRLAELRIGGVGEFGADERCDVADPHDSSSAGC